MSKFTPGPWNILGPKTISDLDANGRGVISSDCAIECSPGGPGHIIAEVFGRSGESMFHDSEANAHLIAAAPELLEELEVLIGNIKVWGPEMNNFRENCASRIERARKAIKKAKGQNE